MVVVIVMMVIVMVMIEVVFVVVMKVPIKMFTWLVVDALLLSLARLAP